MGSKDIDRTALSPFGERELGLNEPVESPQRGDRPFNHLGVSLVEKSVQGRTVPPGGHPHRGAQLGEMRPDVVQPQAACPSRLELPAEVARATRRDDIDLPKSLATTKCARCLGQPIIVKGHLDDVEDGPLPRAYWESRPRT